MCRAPCAPLTRRAGETGRVAFELPAVGAASLAAWCEVQLGSPAVRELFRTGHLTRVIGTRLADGREVVVRARPAAPRIAACTGVQRRLFDSGYPCPQPLAGPAPLEEYEATAPAWAAWNHDQGGLWPRPEDLDVDLNQVDGCGWIDAAARAPGGSSRKDRTRP